MMFKPLNTQRNVKVRDVQSIDKFCRTDNEKRKLKFPISVDTKANKQ